MPTKRHPLPSLGEFFIRTLRHGGIAVAVLFAALAIGVLGYHEFAALPWIDSLLNASMILGGMGPVDTLRTTPAKLFASFYALFSGVVFIGVAGIILAPLVRRVLHRFHLDWEKSKRASDRD